MIKNSEDEKCCVDCKTTKTPLWRSGPAGPKVSWYFFSGTFGGFFVLENGFLTFLGFFCLLTVAMQCVWDQI